MIGRRHLLGGMTAAALPGVARAVASCQPHPQYGQVCVASVALQTLAYAHVQYNSQWCWAASIEMLFGHYRHPVDQRRIVAEAYGGLVNLPASRLTMSTALNRNWIDDYGRPFAARLAAIYDGSAGVYAINNAVIAGALANGDPLIIGAGGHAMVLTSVEYVPGPYGVQIGRMGVFDPWPGRGVRDLSPAEMVPVANRGSLSYVVGIRVF